MLRRGYPQVIHRLFKLSTGYPQVVDKSIFASSLSIFKKIFGIRQKTLPKTSKSRGHFLEKNFFKSRKRKTTILSKVVYLVIEFENQHVCVKGNYYYNSIVQLFFSIVNTFFRRGFHNNWRFIQ